MPRPLGVREPLEALEDEVVYTLSALQSDPRAVALLPMTEGWLELLQDAQKFDRRTRARVVNAEARRVVANQNLDDACEAFATDLLAAVGGDTGAERWRGFFGASAARFIRQALRKQALAVANWLVSDDPVLEPHRRALEQWTRAASTAVEDTEALAVIRARNQVRREQLAEDLSRERDALHAALTDLASECSLPPAWTGAFFRRSAQ